VFHGCIATTSGINPQTNKMPYNETVITGIPKGYLEWYVPTFYFPNYHDFKPTFPKWWENKKAICWSDDCRNEFNLSDVDVEDPHCDRSDFWGTECYIKFRCPKCNYKMVYTAMTLEVIGVQIIEHFRKHKQTNKQ
jgi:hypothetical protein